MSLKPNIFREYDIRGIADRDLNDEGVRELGRAFGTYMQRHSGRRVCLGRDIRLSGPRLRAALLEGLIASGCEVIDLGVVPTPLVYYSVFHLKTDGAIQITGSHNPSEYNGFKAVCGANALYGESIQELLRMIQSGDLMSGQGSVSEADVVTPYVEEISSQFSWKRRIKVVADCGNGTAGPTLDRLL